MLDVRGSRELQATILALKRAERGIRLDINKTARQKLRPVWEGAVSARASTRLERRTMLPARARFSDRGVQLTAATSGRPLGKPKQSEFIPSINWPGVEFGALRKEKTFTQRSRRGTRYQRTMITGNQFRRRSMFGRIAFDAASQTGTQLVAMWVTTVVDELAQVPAVEVEPV